MIMKTFFTLGNDHPQILVKLEDCVLQAIISILEGKSHEYAMDTLYSELFSMEKDLDKDNEALTWFNLAMAPFSIPSMPPPSKFPSKSSAGVLVYLSLFLCLTSMDQFATFLMTNLKVSGAYLKLDIVLKKIPKKQEG